MMNYIKEIYEVLIEYNVLHVRLKNHQKTNKTDIWNILSCPEAKTIFGQVSLIQILAS